MSKKIAILSDIHSNLAALNAVCDELELFSKHPVVEEIIFLGDLLTYGPNPTEVVEKTLKLKSQINCQFVIGNHDAIYMDYPDKNSDYYDGLPMFIRESIDWTRKTMNYDLSSIFDWKDEVVIGNCFLAHANPYGVSDWSYIRSYDDAKKSANVLSRRGFSLGIFGHVHRPMNIEFLSQYDRTIRIYNVGSVGQPRGGSSSYAILGESDNCFSLDIRSFEYDKKETLEQLSRIGFSEKTLEKIRGYY